MSSYLLSAEERETVINGSDAEKTFSVTTSQGKVYRKLMKMVENGNATLVEQTGDKRQPGGIFEVPLNMLTFRDPKPKNGKVAEKKGRPANVALCGSRHTANGEPCSMIRKTGTKGCWRHPNG